MLRVEARSPVVDGGAAGDVPAVDVVATCDPATGALTVLAVNRHPSEAAALNATLHAPRGYVLAEHVTLGGGDPLATNTAAFPERVHPVAVTGSRLDGGVLIGVLPPVSW